MVEQRQQRALTRIERDVVKVVKHARLGQLAQFGVDKSAAQHRDDLGVVCLDGLCNAKRRIHRARKRHRQQHHIGRVACHRFERERAQHLVHQRGRGGQGLGQWFERGLAARQRFGVAHKLKAFVHRVAQHIGQVVQVQRGQVLGLVVQAQGAKSPAQRVAALLMNIDIERGEARPFGQEAAAHDAVRQRAVAPLQKGNGGANGGQIPVLLRGKALHRRALLFGGHRIDPGGHCAQTFRREQAQHQRQRQVLLRRRNAARAQKPREVGGRGVRCVELRHRGDDGQHAKRWDGHGGGGQGDAVPPWRDRGRIRLSRRTPIPCQPAASLALWAP